MKIISSYKVKIKNYKNIFADTVKIYRQAVSFFLDVCNKRWGVLGPLKLKERNNYIETITISTASHPTPDYNFNEKFYKMPSYLIYVN